MSFIRYILFFILSFLVSLCFAQCITTNITGDLIISADQSMEGTYHITGKFKINTGINVTVIPHSINSCGELVINANDIEVLGTIDANGSGHVGGAGGDGQTSGINTSYLSSCANKDNCLAIQVYGGNK